MTNKKIALDFFKECEEGKGWAGCQEYCAPNATFSCQAEPLEGMDTLEAYTNWMQDLYEYMPNAGYETKSISTNEDVSHISFYAVFTGTHTHEGGPVPPTGKSVRTDYVYVMELSGGKISHLTKIWNSAIAFKQLGWND